MARDLTPLQCQRVEQLFDKLFSVSPENRMARLASECPDDPNVRSELEGLLAAAERSSSALGTDWSVDRIQKEASQALASFRDLAAGAMVGQYRIVRLLAHGGMGAVYEAEQESPRRRVALKLVRRGLVSPSIFRRFEFEADTLGRLDHPGIARIYQAGITRTSLGAQPFFAMEFIDGKPLDDYAQENKLNLNQRLRLLIEICQAVHHAHTKGVIHRDLKPANILVTSEGHPKVLDFGVARAIDSDISATMSQTQDGEMIGTLPYMSPEQAEGKVEELDTASDVYALGVIAYELLGTRVPYELKGKPMHQAVRMICEDEPAKLGSLDRALRGDIETIVAKAIEKEKARRYEAAGEMASDLARYLNHEPIMARVPSRWYYLKKFTARNRILVGAFAVVLAALALGMIGTTIGIVRANQHRQIAERRAAEYQAIAKFLENYQFKDHWRPENTANSTVASLHDTLRTLNAGALKDQPLVDASIRYVLGTALRAHSLTERNEAAGSGLAASPYRQTLLDEAQPLLIQSLTARQQELGEDHLDVALSRLALGAVYCEQAKYDLAEPLLRKSLSLIESHKSDMLDDLEGNLWYLARARAHQGPEGLAEAEKLLKHCFELSRASRPDDLIYQVYLVHELSKTYLLAGRYEEAQDAVTDANDLMNRVMKNDRSDQDRHSSHLKMAAMNWTLLQIHEKRKWWSAARNLCVHSLQYRANDPIPDVDHCRWMLRYQIKRGDLSIRLGSFTEAEEAYGKGMEILDFLYGPNGNKRGSEFADLLRRQYTVAILLWKFDEAEQICRHVIDLESEIYGFESFDALGSTNNLCFILRAKGTPMGVTAPLYFKLYRAATYSKKDLPPPWAAVFMSWYGPYLAEAGKFDQAHESLRTAYYAIAKSSQQRQRTTRGVLAGLLQVSKQLGRPDEVEQWRNELAAWEAANETTKLSVLEELVPPHSGPIVHD